MATYKVLQDIEAEDKLVGPLSLRQFIYAGVAAVALYICFLSYTRGVPFLMVFFLPVAAIGTFFGFPWKGEQPTEIWALARLRFSIKPRVRIWNQSGVKDLVTITAPRNVHVKPQVRHLSQNEVQSRLKALADTIDSRGWATRNANYRYFSNQMPSQSDRLVNATDMQPGAIPMDAFLPANDMMDDQNPVAQNLDNLLNRSQVAQRQRVIDEMNSAQIPAALVATMQEPAPYGSQPMQPQPAQMAPPAQTAPNQMPQLPAPVMPGGAPGQYAAQYPQQYQSQYPPQYPPEYAPPAQYPTPYQYAQQQPMQQPAPDAAAANNYWFVNNGTPEGPQAAAHMPMGAGQPAAAVIPTDSAQYSQARMVPTPGGPIEAAAPAPATPAQPVTRPTDPAILDLAINNDLDVATIARRAHKDLKQPSGEVEVRLR